jgi:undecaprenyl-diphosphatase
MMDLPILVKALILGIVEGLTEFLPISSTGHLIITGSLLGYTDEASKIFEIVIQLGAILAVCWEYRARLTEAVRGLVSEPVQQQFAAHLLVAFLPAVVLGLLLHHLITTYLFNPLTVAGALIVGGLVILYVERRPYHPHFETIDSISWREALKIGFAQTLAMFPGISRSGATIMGGMVFGLSRKAATEFSFFLAIPTMFAATVYDAYKGRSLLHAADIPVFAVGLVTSFIAAMFAVRGLLRFISSHSFEVFAWYRIVFGLLVLGAAYMGLIVEHPG